MAVKHTLPKMPDTYFRLVKRFPLTQIRNEAHLDVALSVIDDLMTEDLDAGAQEYLSALASLVETYEDVHYPIPDASEAEVLDELLRANGLSQQRLAKAVGISQSTLSAVLNGSRSLTKEQIVKLAKFFHVSPAAFLPA